VVPVVESLTLAVTILTRLKQLTSATTSTKESTTTTEQLREQVLGVHSTTTTHSSSTF
jgi:hypothetical protein